MADNTGFLLRYPGYSSTTITTPALDAAYSDALDEVSRTCLISDAGLADRAIYLVMASLLFRRYPAIGLVVAGLISGQTFEEQAVKVSTTYAVSKNPYGLLGPRTGQAENPFQAEFEKMLAQYCTWIGTIYNECDLEPAVIYTIDTEGTNDTDAINFPVTYAQLDGSGNIVLVHNFGTTNVIVSCRDANGVVFNPTSITIGVPNINSVTVNFSGSGSFPGIYTVVIDK